jgi:hypothetical protein
MYAARTPSTERSPAEFSGSWQLDIAKSKTDVKEDLVGKIDQKSGDIAIEEISLGKSTCTAKCALGKSCELDDNGRKMTAILPGHPARSDAPCE